MAPGPRADTGRAVAPRALPRLALALGLAACGGPESLADCAAVADPAAREQCRWEQIQPLAAGLAATPPAPGAAAALDAALATVEPAESRDLLRLRLSIAHPTEAARFCRGAETTGAQEKCRQVLGRPHLGTRPRAPRGPGQDAPKTP